MIPFFKAPKQVMFKDLDIREDYLGGIAYHDEVICGCCGDVFKIADLYEIAHGEYEPIKVFRSWVNVSDEIIGDDYAAVNVEWLDSIDHFLSDENS